MLSAAQPGKWAAVIGHPIDHSLSPTLHRTAYELLGLPWEYFKFDVTEDDLATFLEELPPGCAGLSVTAPLKRALLEYADAVDGLAKLTSSANTIVFSTVMSAAFNTDVHGMVATLQPLLHANAKVGTPVILGTGATASSALAAVRTLGYDATVIVGRSFSGPNNALLSAVEFDLEVQPVPLQRMEWVTDAIGAAPLVISTIPPEVTEGFVGDVEPAEGAVLLDVTYGDGRPPLAAPFEEAGGHIASPLAMLTHQGLAQVKLMTNREAPYEPVFEAVQAAAESR